MKISYNWLKEYLDIGLMPQQLSELLTDIGLEVENMTEYKGPGNGLEGLVVGHVKKVEKHPDADKLTVTQVEVGGDEVLQIVCGAPNVAEGQKVVVALPGVTLYPAKGESFTIKKAKIRGVESFGMICAEDEIGIGTSHDGIIVLPESARTGMKASDFYGLKNDWIFEIALTPNRADAFSHLGVARDVRAALNIRFDKNLPLKFPVIDESVFTKKETPLEVVVEEPAMCPRYSGILIKNVKVGESPLWLKERLRSVGQRPINNIVDVTNFILQEFGQPLHAFDADEIRGGKVIVKTLPANTKFTTLDEVERVLSGDDLMICDAEGGMCIAGIFGGMHSGVSEKTHNIFLESAHFNPAAIRKTSTRLGLRTDAAMRFEKGTDPAITVTALKRAVNLILQVAGGEAGSAVVDVYPKPVPPFKITLHYAHLDRLIGYPIDADTIHDILENLGISIESESQQTLELSIPPFKVDVHREADVIEEVLRIYGLNRIPHPETIRTSISLRGDSDLREQVNNKVSDYLSSIGFREMINNSLSRSEYYSANGNGFVYLQKSANADLNVLRQNMLYSGLEAVAYNLNRKNNDLKLYEIGKSYHQDDSRSFGEAWHLTLFVTGMKHPESWTAKSKQADFFYLKAVVHNVLRRMGVSRFEESAMDTGIFQYGLGYSFREKPLVQFGLLQPEHLNKLDIRPEVYYADFDWENVFELAKSSVILFTEIPRFPGVRRDLALLLKEDIPFAAVRKIAVEEGGKILKGVNLFDFYQDVKLGEGMKSYAVSYFFEHEERTLTDSEVDELMTKLMSRYRNELKAEIR
ncbi:MAG TPA: phenylalanine--tRNA ligase subunit beta [Chitinophagales bacterium]|nr:phenylalanine--tRNA ligase subunit beta [Chitinophagales bacterium]